MISVEKIRVVDQSGLTAIFQTTADMIVVVDRATTVPTATCPMPTAPIDGQIFILSSRVAVTNLTMDAGAIPISGNITTLAAGGQAGWIYDTVSNRWFRYS